MDRVQKAMSLLESGMNCSQAILAAFGEPHGMDIAAARRIGRPLGGGIARMGQTCGAVTGAIMVLGLAADKRPSEGEARAAAVASAREFTALFEKRHKTILCRELLGVDLSTEQGYKKFREENLMSTVCPEFVRSAAEILNELEEQR